MARVFKPFMVSAWIVGVVGALQFEVLADRVRTEYGIPVHFEPAPAYATRWLASDDPTLPERFAQQNRVCTAQDLNGDTVFFARNAWHLETTAKDWPELRFLKTVEHALS